MRSRKLESKQIGRTELEEDIENSSSPKELSALRVKGLGDNESESRDAGAGSAKDFNPDFDDEDEDGIQVEGRNINNLRSSSASKTKNVEMGGRHRDGKTESKGKSTPTQLGKHINKDACLGILPISSIN
jgi:hypothetical protein